MVTSGPSRRVARPAFHAKVAYALTRARNAGRPCGQLPTRAMRTPSYAAARCVAVITVTSNPRAASPVAIVATIAALDWVAGGEEDATIATRGGPGHRT